MAIPVLSARHYSSFKYITAANSVVRGVKFTPLEGDPVDAVLFDQELSLLEDGKPFLHTYVSNCALQNGTTDNTKARIEVQLGVIDEIIELSQFDINSIRVSLQPKVTSRAVVDYPYTPSTKRSEMPYATYLPDATVFEDPSADFREVIDLFVTSDYAEDTEDDPFSHIEGTSLAGQWYVNLFAHDNLNDRYFTPFVTTDTQYQVREQVVNAPSGVAFEIQESDIYPVYIPFISLNSQLRCKMFDPLPFQLSWEVLSDTEIRVFGTYPKKVIAAMSSYIPDGATIMGRYLGSYAWYDVVSGIHVKVEGKQFSKDTIDTIIGSNEHVLDLSNKSFFLTPSTYYSIYQGGSLQKGPAIERIGSEVIAAYSRGLHRCEITISEAVLEDLGIQKTRDRLYIKTPDGRLLQRGGVPCLFEVKNIVSTLTADGFNCRLLLWEVYDE